MRTLICVVVLAGLLLTAGAAMAAVTDNYATPSGGPQTQWGVWQNVGGVWTWYAPSGAAIQNTIDVTGTVEIWEEDSFNMKAINFHWGRTDGGAGTSPTISQVITGSQSTNTNCTIDIVCTGAASKLTELDYQSSLYPWGGDTSSIPVKWEYSLTGAPLSWTECAYSPDSKKATAFPAGLGAGINTPFFIKVTATAKPTQANGAYALDPVISVTPVM